MTRGDETPVNVELTASERLELVLEDVLDALDPGPALARLHALLAEPSGLDARSVVLRADREAARLSTSIRAGWPSRANLEEERARWWKVAAVATQARKDLKEKEQP
jgi:hypothetical protein